jgi:hypothetical protein
VASMERRFVRSPGTVAVTGPYRFYDWDWIGDGGRAGLRSHPGPARARRGAPRAPDRGRALRRQLRGAAHRARRDRRFRHHDSNSTGKTPTWGGALRRSAPSSSSARATSIRPRGATWRSDAGRCSGSTSATSGGRRFTTGPRISSTRTSDAEMPDTSPFCCAIFTRIPPGATGG